MRRIAVLFLAALALTGAAPVAAQEGGGDALTRLLEDGTVTNPFQQGMRPINEPPPAVNPFTGDPVTPPPDFAPEIVPTGFGYFVVRGPSGDLLPLVKCGTGLIACSPQFEGLQIDEQLDLHIFLVTLTDAPPPAPDGPPSFGLGVGFDRSPQINFTDPGGHTTAMDCSINTFVTRGTAGIETTVLPEGGNEFGPAQGPAFGGFIGGIAVVGWVGDHPCIDSSLMQLDPFAVDADNQVDYRVLLDGPLDPRHLSFFGGAVRSTTTTTAPAKETDDGGTNALPLVLGGAAVVLGGGLLVRRAISGKKEPDPEHTVLDDFTDDDTWEGVAADSRPLTPEEQLDIEIDDVVRDWPRNEIWKETIDTIMGGGREPYRQELIKRMEQRYGPDHPGIQEIRDW